MEHFMNEINSFLPFTITQNLEAGNKKLKSGMEFVKIICRESANMIKYLHFLNEGTVNKMVQLLELL